jgi:hypothetical protein
MIEFKIHQFTDSNTVCHYTNWMKRFISHLEEIAGENKFDNERWNILLVNTLAVLLFIMILAVIRFFDLKKMKCLLYFSCDFLK